jgi:arylsulfatase A-like enzyme
VAPVPRPVTWRPNVLFIMCDQLNVRMLGHEENGYGGVSQSLTPNLDALAAEGVRFSNATTASAVCQASRYTILTGRWPFHHGVRANQIWEPRTETTFPELARAAEYKTANYGLHHLMWDNQPPGWGDDHGFEIILDLGNYGMFCSLNGQATYSAPSNSWFMPGLPVFGEFEKTGYSFSQNEFHPSGYFADQVIGFLRNRAGPHGDGKPFVCWYSMISPHTPILPSGVAPDDWAHIYHPFEQLDLAPNFDRIPTTQRLAYAQSQFEALSPDQFREALSYYYALISQLDANVGRVLAELEALGIADDTLVVFTADHGEMATEMGCFTKGAGSYDALTRIPLIMRLPDVLPAGRTIVEPAINIDIFPTMAEVTGVPMTDEQREAIDGVSLASLMIESSPPVAWRQEAFHVLGTTADFGGHQTMVRTLDAKYAADEWGDEEEFYDLESDPWEMNDLFLSPDSEIQAQITDLKGRFDAWWNNEQGHAPHYKLIGAWTASPLRADNPVPSDGFVGAPRDPNPSWLPCTGAAVQEVYLGTDPEAMQLFATLGHMEDHFNAGTLDAATTYYWRVDQINANGTNEAPPWSFTTHAFGNGGPGLATTPSPEHNSTGVAPRTPISCEVPPTAESLDIWFGPEGNLQLLAPGVPTATPTWQPGSLAGGETYEWRVDCVSVVGTTEGDIWRFTITEEGLPGLAQPLTPTHFARNVAPSELLTWSAGTGAESHDVWFGTTFPLTFQGNQTATVWDPGVLPPDQTYYWRVDEVNASGTKRGWTSRFTR